MYPSGTDRQGVASNEANAGCDLSGAHSGSLASSAGVIQLGKASRGRRVATVLSRSPFKLRQIRLNEGARRGIQRDRQQRHRAPARPERIRHAPRPRAREPVVHQPLRVVGLGKALRLEPAPRRVGIGPLEDAAGSGAVLASTSAAANSSTVS